MTVKRSVLEKGLVVLKDTTWVKDLPCPGVGKVDGKEEKNRRGFMDSKPKNFGQWERKKEGVFRVSTGIVLVRCRTKDGKKR